MPAGKQPLTEYKRDGAQRLISRLTTEQASALRAVMVQIVTDQTIVNGQRDEWWYTWISCRDRINTLVWPWLVNSYRRAHSQASAHHSPTLTPLPSVRRPALLGWSRLLKKLLWMVRWVQAERFSGGLSLPITTDVCIISIVDDRTVDDSGIYRDTYFGDLAAHLALGGEVVLHCGIVDGSPAAAVKALRRAARRDVITLGRFIKWHDLATAFMTAANTRFHLGNASTPWHDDGGDIMKLEFLNARGDIFVNLILEKAIGRMLDHYPSARLIHMYENNPWEKACSIAACKRQRQSIGYLHCAVLPSHLKNYIDHAERKLRPAPDKIICTGPNARRLFLSLGEHDPSRVLAGCSLNVDLTQRESNETAVITKVGRVLILLTGLETSVAAFEFAAEIAEALPEIDFVVRPHPLLDFDRLVRLSRSGQDLAASNRLRQCSEPSLERSISNTDLVAYHSTTAAMHAVAAGVPAIALDVDDTVEDDPLFECPGLVRSAVTIDQFVSQLREFEQAPQEALELERSAARAYIDGYFSPPSPERLAVFMRLTDSAVQ